MNLSKNIVLGFETINKILLDDINSLFHNEFYDDFIKSNIVNDYLIDIKNTHTINGDYIPSNYYKLNLLKLSCYKMYNNEFLFVDDNDNKIKFNYYMGDDEESFTMSINYVTYSGDYYDCIKYFVLSLLNTYSCHYDINYLHNDDYSYSQYKELESNENTYKNKKLELKNNCVNFINEILNVKINDIILRVSHTIYNDKYFIMINNNIFNTSGQINFSLEKFNIKFTCCFDNIYGIEYYKKIFESVNFNECN